MPTVAFDEYVRTSYKVQKFALRRGAFKGIRRLRERNHRLQIVRNVVRWADVQISAKHQVRRLGNQYWFTIQGTGELFPLPRLGYGPEDPWTEIRNIWTQVLRDIMSNNELREIRLSLAKLHDKVDATKTELTDLRTDFTGLRTDFNVFSKGTTETLAELQKASTKIIDMLPR